MEGLLFLVLLYWLFKKATGAAKKQMKKQSSPDERTKRMAEEIKRARREKQLSMQQVSSQPVGEGESHMEYTRDAHGCVSQEKEYMGSLLADTSEGEDACEQDLGHERETVIAPESVYANEIGSEPVLDLSARGIYQGVVRSEMLTRPAQRMRRRA